MPSKVNKINDLQPYDDFMKENFFESLKDNFYEVGNKHIKWKYDVLKDFRIRRTLIKSYEYILYLKTKV